MEIQMGSEKDKRRKKRNLGKPKEFSQTHKVFWIEVIMFNDIMLRELLKKTSSLKN